MRELQLKITLPLFFWTRCIWGSPLILLQWPCCPLRNKCIEGEHMRNDAVSANLPTAKVWNQLQVSIHSFFTVSVTKIIIRLLIDVIWHCMFAFTSHGTAFWCVFLIVNYYKCGKVQFWDWRTTHVVCWCKQQKLEVCILLYSTSLQCQINWHIWLWLFSSYTLTM